MKHLFAPEGEAALAAALQRRPLLAFDFDGTLAPIVARPEDARLSQAVARRLALLSERLPTAIITGRQVEDVRERLHFEPRFIVGNHGAEDPQASHPVFPTSVFDSVRDRLYMRADELHRAGVAVEDKHHSLALHYRLARDKREAIALITALLADADPRLEIVGGKQVVNVVARAAPDKAGALALLVARCGAQGAVFAGDDVNDEPVFARREPTWFTVRVGRDHPHSQAMYCLDSTAEVAAMLERMLVLIGAH